MEHSTGNCVRDEKMDKNTRRDSHIAPKHFLLPLISLPDWVVEIESEDDLGFMFVT